MISITIVTICNEISIPSIFENIKLPQNELNSMLLLLITFFAIPPIPQNKSYLIVLYLYKICTGYVWDAYGNGVDLFMVCSTKFREVLHRVSWSFLNGLRGRE